MELFIEALDREVDELDRNGVRLRFIGDRGTLQARTSSSASPPPRRAPRRNAS